MGWIFPQNSINRQQYKRQMTKTNKKTIQKKQKIQNRVTKNKKAIHKTVKSESFEIDEY